MMTNMRKPLRHTRSPASGCWAQQQDRLPRTEGAFVGKMPESERPKAGKKSSKSRNSKEQGDEYDGELNKAGKREGRGICRFAGGDVFDGQWKAGKMDGRGTYRMADGDVYEGLWKAGAKEGPGTYWYASGRADVVKYSGEFAAA